MRWRLGRSGATARFIRTPPALAHVVATSTEAGNTTNASARVRSHRNEGSSESTATGAIEMQGEIADEFVYVTAESCPPSGGRPGNDETASCHSGQRRVRDSLTLSVISFVENLRSRPRPQAFISHDSERMANSIGTGHTSGEDGNRKCCGRGAASFVASTVSVGQNINGNGQQAAAVGALSSSSAPGHLDGRQEDPLILELCDHIFRRGMVVGDCAVLGSARACLDLMLSREITMEAMEKTGPTELISVATTNLDLSASVVVFLLDQLVDSESTAFRLADSHLLQSYNNAATTSIQQVCVEESDGNTTPAHLRHTIGKKTTVVAGPVAKAAEAAMALSEACRAWKATIEAANSMTKKASFCEPWPEQAEVTDGVVPEGLLRAGTEHPLSSTPSLQHLESLKGRHHSRTERCSAASASTSGTVEVPQEPDEQQRPSDHVRSAIRMVTSGAKDCYGQLVVLGYKEFTVRDSTWHRVGPKNAIFVLGRRRSPNGVQIGRRDVGGAGEVGGGDGAGSDSNGLHSGDASIGYRRSMRQRQMLARSQHPSREKPTQRDGGDGTGNGDGHDATFETGVGHGDQAAFKTPDTTPIRLSEARGREHLPHRGRDACARTAEIDAGTANKTGKNRGYGKDDGNRRERGKRGKLSSDRREEKPVAVAEQASALYQVQLSLSPEQREAGENAEGQKCTSKAQAGGERRKDIVEIPCVADEACDMYQIGRMQVAENDFVVKGPLHKSQPAGKVCGPVSRYAARLLVGRSGPHRCTIFAGGFNSRGCLTLPKSSPKWVKENGDWDAVTPFGVRIFKPEIGEWREVTVTGDMRRTRVGRLDTVGDLVAGDTNELTSGTVVDVGGVQMLYESAEMMARLGGVQPSRVIELLNDHKPQCPVRLQTLRFKPLQSIPTRATTLLSEPAGVATGEDAAIPGCGGSDVPNGLVVAGTRGGTITTVATAGRASYAVVGVDGDDEGESTDAEGGGNADIEAKASVPHIFPTCGHVHGYAKQLAFGPCPMCRAPGPLVEILFGWCRAIDREVPTVVFNPCGHAASLEVAERWSRLAMPNNAPPDAVYRPICPYCAKPLQCKNGERPYTKMIFAQ